MMRTYPHSLNGWRDRAGHAEAEVVRLQQYLEAERYHAEANLRQWAEAEDEAKRLRKALETIRDGEGHPTRVWRIANEALEALDTP